MNVPTSSQCCGIENAPQGERKNMTLEENHSKIWNHLNEIRTGMLCTHSEGLVSSRPMQLVQDNYEGRLYLYAENDAQKVLDILKSPTVNMNFTDNTKNLYISLSGIAAVEKQGKNFDHFWTDAVATWFSDHKDPKDAAVLIIIEITHADVWETNGNGFTRAFQFMKAKFNDSKPKVGTHETLEQ